MCGIALVVIFDCSPSAAAAAQRAVTSFAVFASIYRIPRAALLHLYIYSAHQQLMCLRTVVYIYANDERRRARCYCFAAGNMCEIL